MHTSTCTHPCTHMCFHLFILLLHSLVFWNIKSDKYPNITVLWASTETVIYWASQMTLMGRLPCSYLGSCRYHLQLNHHCVNDELSQASWPFSQTTHWYYRSSEVKGSQNTSCLFTNSILLIKTSCLSYHWYMSYTVCSDFKFYLLTI